jgi:hypothetical protein
LGGEHLFDSPDVQRALADVIRDVPELLKQKWTADTALERAQSREAMLWSGIAVVAVVAVVLVLSLSGRISSDSTTFILGAIVGYAFTFLRDWFSPKD